MDNTLSKFIEYLESLVSKVKGREITQRNIRELTAMASDLENYTREAYQSKVKVDVKKIFNSLPDLNEDETKLLESLIIGDAKSYIKAETNYDNWILQLEKIVAQIKDTDLESASPDYLIELLGENVVFKRITEDLNFYHKQLERVQSFEKNILEDGISTNEAKHIIDMLKFKLASPNH